MLRGPLEAAKCVVEQQARRVATDALTRLRRDAERAAAEAQAAVLNRYGRDLEALAVSHARVASYIESQVGDAESLLCDPKGAVRLALAALEAKE
jgi:hypothetical protein